MFGMITGWFTAKQYYVSRPKRGARGRFWMGESTVGLAAVTRHRRETRVYLR